MAALRPLLFLLFTSVTCFADWIFSSRVGDTAYFVFAFPPRVERYDLGAQKWISPLRLPSSRALPTAALVDATGIYIARGKTVWKYTLLGSDEVYLLQVPDPIIEFVADGNLLFVNHSTSYNGRFTSFDKTKKSKIETSNLHAGYTRGSSIAPSINKIFGRKNFVSPSDITYLTYTDAGNFIHQGDSPHHGYYPDATETWVFPDEKTVVDSSGTLYNTTTVSYAGSLGLPINDFQFVDGIPFAVSGKRLTGFTENLLPLKNVTLPFEIDAFHLVGDKAVVFGADHSKHNGIIVHCEPLGNLKAPIPVKSVNPIGLRYTPDSMFLDKNGILHLLSKSSGNIFRWNPATFSYLKSIPLLGNAGHAAYSDESHSIYTAYSSGIIYSIALDTESFLERPYTAIPHPPRGLVAVDPFILTVEGEHSWQTHRIFDRSGDQVGFKNLNHDSKDFVWSPMAQKLYYMRDSSPNYIHSEEINANGTAYPGVSAGGIGRKNQSGYGSFFHPLRVSPDGTAVMDGSGRFFDANTLQELPARLLESAIFADMVWQENEITTSRLAREGIEVQTWSSLTLQPLRSRTFGGKPLRLFPLNGQRLLSVGTSVDGSLSFTVLDSSLDEVVPPTLAAPAGLRTSAPESGKLTLFWTDVAGESGYIVERKRSESSTWTSIGTTGANITKLDLPTVASNHTYDYRVIAARGVVRSVPSPSLNKIVSGPPIAPTRFTGFAVGGVITLRWKDVNFETGYQIEVKTPSGNWRRVDRPEANTESLSVAGFAAGTLYQFRIHAANSMGESSWKSTSVKTPPPVPEIGVIESRKTELIDGRSTILFEPWPGRNGSIRKIITVANLGTDDLVVHRVRISGAHAKDFHIGKLPKITLRKKQAASFAITFKPRNIGPRTATLQIYSNDSDENPFDVKIVARPRPR